jgi:dipeptidase
MTSLPNSYDACDTGKFNRENAWWAFNFVANWAAPKYSYMSKDIREKQDGIELEEREHVKAVDAEAIALYKESTGCARTYLTDYCTENADRVVREWWAFANYLIVKYDDEYLNTPEKIAQ